MERSTVAATNRWGRGPSGGAHGAGFNELFHPPLVPPLNRRFHRRFSSGARPLAPRSIRVHVRFRAALPPPLLFFFFSLSEKSRKPFLSFFPSPNLEVEIVNRRALLRTTGWLNCSTVVVILLVVQEEGLVLRMFLVSIIQIWREFKRKIVFPEFRCD